MYNPSGYDPVNRETAFGMARKKRSPLKSFFDTFLMKKHIHDGHEPALFAKENLNMNTAILDGHPGFTRSGAIETGTKHSYNHAKYESVNPPLSHERNLDYSKKYSQSDWTTDYALSTDYEFL